MTATAQPKVYEAFAAAMSELEFISKDGEMKQKMGGKMVKLYDFRGIDEVMNSVGPIFRKHQLFLIPETKDITVSQGATVSGKVMQRVVVDMSYTVAHADGSTFTGSAFGEGNDTADKATAKASSVALRTFLLQSLVIPTGETDPDAERIEGAAPNYRNINVDTADKQTMLNAMNQAMQAGDREAYERISQAGLKRFGK